MDSLPNIEDLNRISLELVPQKKGLIMKHVEYLIKSHHISSQVHRRYSDFQALCELLLARYPYRLIPRLPPSKVMAMVVGVDSSVLEQRKKALQRWILLVTSHPAFHQDPMLQYFLTYSGEDHSTSIKDQFRHIPDEFVTSDKGYRARDLTEPGLRARVSQATARMAEISRSVMKIKQVLERMVERSVCMSADMVELGKELVCVGSEVIKDEGSSDVKKGCRAVARECMDISSRWDQHKREEELELLLRISLVHDALIGHADMIGRNEKGVSQDHKKAAEKIANIKRKSLQGVLAANAQFVEDVEKRIAQHEIVLMDLESRQAFGLLCLDEETNLAFTYCQVLGEVVNKMGEIEGKGMAEIAEMWTRFKIQERPIK